MTKTERRAVIDVPERAVRALKDLGACADPACLHALPRAEALLRKLSEYGGKE